MARRNTETELEIIARARQKEVITVKELSLLLGVHHSTIRTYMKQDRLPYTKMGRTYLFNREQVMNLINKGALADKYITKEDAEKGEEVARYKPDTSQPKKITRK